MFRVRSCLVVLAFSCVAHAGAPLDFDKGVAPFLKRHCVRCHGGRQPKAQLMLHKLTRSIAPADVPVWRAIAKQLEEGRMPPKSQTRPEAAQRDQVLDWINTHLTSSQKVADRLGYPSEGNRVDHSALFSPKRVTHPATPARIWRVRPSIYESFVSQVVRRDFYSGRRRGSYFSPPWGLTGDGIRDYAELYWIGEAETELLMSNALRAANMMTQKPSRRSRESLVFRNFTRAAGKPKPQEMSHLVETAFPQILRRKPTDSERQRYVTFLAKNVEDLGRVKGMETTLAALLLHPSAVFRFELGQGTPDKHGRVRLAPVELAYAIGYTLTDEAPDRTLLEAARTGQLESRAQIQAHVRRLLNDPAIDKPNILRFFREYFGYTKAPQVFKDLATKRKARLQGVYYPEVLVADTDNLILHILDEDTDVLRQLLTTDKSFVSTGPALRSYRQRQDKARKAGNPLPKNPFVDRRNKVYLHYDFDPDKWTEEIPVRLDKTQRAGILTQPSWLIAHSTNFDNHAIHRGKWIRDRLLGGYLPDTPITVEAQLPDDDTLTLRQKMRVTREAFCWDCHRSMDPLGLPFEMFDHFGRYRASDLGKPTVTTGAIHDSGDPKLDGPVENAVALLHRLADSTRVRQVFLRHLFRFYLGRNETPEDASTLVEMDTAYLANKGSLKAVLVSLLSSDAFLYRTTPPTPGESR